VEPVSLHHAGEALALAGRGDVHLLTGGEEVGRQLLTGLVGVGVVGADLDQLPPWGHARLREVTRLRLGDLAARDLAVAELDGGVAVGLDLAHLGHDVGARRDDGHRHDPVVGVPHLRHAELGAQQTANVSDLRTHGCRRVLCVLRA
jgi:hypothetical protein